MLTIVIPDDVNQLAQVFLETPCFRSASELFSMIEHDIVGFGGPELFEQDITLPEAPNESLTMYLRHIEDCADYLLGRPDLASEVEFQPRLIFKPDDKTQVIGEMYTAYLWHIILVWVIYEW